MKVLLSTFIFRGEFPPIPHTHTNTHTNIRQPKGICTNFQLKCCISWLDYYIGVDIWQNSSKLYLKIGALMAYRLYLSKLNSKSKKQTKKFQFYITLIFFVSVSGFWCFHYQGFSLEYNQNEQSYYQKLPLLGLRVSPKFVLFSDKTNADLWITRSTTHHQLVQPENSDKPGKSEPSVASPSRCWEVFKESIVFLINWKNLVLSLSDKY